MLARRPRPAFLGQGSNETHASTTDRDERLYKEGSGAGEPALLHRGRGLENRSGFVVDARLTRAAGYAECLAGLDLAEQHIRAGGKLSTSPCPT